MLGSIAEEFHVPLVEGGAADQPLGLVMSILELREYARAKRALESATDEKEIPVTPMVEMVWAVEGELWRQRKARLEAEGEE